MKKRLKRKLLKKKKRVQLPSDPYETRPVSPQQLSGLAVECWRIRSLLPDFANNNKCSVLSSIVEKMTALLMCIGVEIEDPIGLDYKDGMTINVALFENSDSLPAGLRRITETLSPNVYIAGTLAQAARVIVSVGKGDK